jgi:hypothetical protein
MFYLFVVNTNCNSQSGCCSELWRECMYYRNKIILPSKFNVKLQKNSGGGRRGHPLQLWLCMAHCSIVTMVFIEINHFFRFPYQFNFSHIYVIKVEHQKDILIRTQFSIQMVFHELTSFCEEENDAKIGNFLDFFVANFNNFKSKS